MTDKPLTDVLAEALQNARMFTSPNMRLKFKSDSMLVAAMDSIDAALARYEAEKVAPKEEPRIACRFCGETIGMFTAHACGHPDDRPAKADPQPALTKCIHCGCYDHGAGNWDCQGNPKWTAQSQPAPSSAEVRAEIRDECERRAEEHAGIVAPVCPTCRDEGEVEDIHAVDGYRPCPTCKPAGGTP